MTRLLLVGAGGGLGAIARYGVNLLVARFWHGAFPLATFLVNVAGSFAIGLLASLALRRAVGPELWLLLVTGFLGAFTTFSAFEHETGLLLQRGAWGWAGVNVAGSLLAGLAALRLGEALAR